MRIRVPVILDGELLHEWWIGPTGSGKSRLAWEVYPEHYQKQLNKWWDGYTNENIVVIEEWSPKNEVSGSQLKIWADRYPFPGQIKGGTLQKIRPRKIIVLSNYTISECFPNHQDRDPLFRRFHELHFPADADQARDNATHLSALTEVACAVPESDLSSDAIESPHSPRISLNSSESHSSSELVPIYQNGFPAEVDSELLNFLNGLVE